MSGLPVIGPGRGGRKPTGELSIEIVRSLGEEDLPLLANPPPVGSTAPTVQALRASHHQLAQLLTQGRTDTEVAMISGYSLSRISILKKDPTFAELLAGYTTVRQQVFVDTLERMRILGLSALDELQERLENSPEKWSHRELLEMADLLLVKPRVATAMGQASAAAQSGGASGAGAGVTVNVKFVSSETPTLVIDGEAQ